MTDTLRRIDVDLGERSYPITIGAGLLAAAAEHLTPISRGRRVLVVTDANVVAHGHADTLEASLAAAGYHIDRLMVEAGEKAKSFGELDGLIDGMLALGADRKSTVIALGGGVVGDLAGFAAAILMRGVDLVQIPTTLLSQVDSSVGGKTGINTRRGKNLVGAFHQPKAVLIDTDVLSTLPDRELRSGYAEVVKYGCLRDRAFFAWLEAHGGDVLGGDHAAQAQAIARSLEIKAEVVRRDEREISGERALLNLGHTFAHAYEAIAGYTGGVLHGEAVSVGMVQAARLSARMGCASDDERQRLETHLSALGMPTSPRRLRNDGFPPDLMMEAMRRDKKAEDGMLQFVLWRAIGEAFVARDVPEPLLTELLGSDG